MGFPGSSDSKESACNAGDLGSISGLGRSPGGGNGNALQYFCLGNPMHRGIWQATVHGVAKSWTRLSDFIFFLSIQFSGFPGNSAGKESTCNARDPGLIPGSERSPGQGILATHSSILGLSYWLRW